VTLTDQQSGLPTASKTVMVTTSNLQWGRLRSEVESRAYGVAPLNIDVQPEVLADSRIALRLTIEYSQGRLSDAEGNTEHISKVRLNESVSIIVPNGQSLLVTQSADPVSDRKVTVDVKATVVK
jgi:hypothetical protein